jgi:hypothetical protein
MQGSDLPEREVSESRATSLESIESLVEHLSFATPSPTELEQASWERGHVWRHVSTGEAGTDDPERA